MNASIDLPRTMPPIFPTSNLSSSQDEEKVSHTPESLARPVHYVSAVFVGLAMCLIIVLLLGFTTSKLIVECLMDGNWSRMGYIAVMPLLLLVGLFFIIVIWTNLFQIIGPIGGVKRNSRNYSAEKPDLNRAYAEGFKPPHITIQMPVYKEGLEGVIIPTVSSLKAAISYYESHGGMSPVANRKQQHALIQGRNCINIHQR
jgi:NADH:ubiquinone oxidoreductase subunit 5 (subunit L)/multisubunit Na+/H+ antiporter MnhA subunit